MLGKHQAETNTLGSKGCDGGTPYSKVDKVGCNRGRVCCMGVLILLKTRAREGVTFCGDGATLATKKEVVTRLEFEDNDDSPMEYDSPKEEEGGIAIRQAF
ncbi:hypothetical protein BVRB_3g058570 [Beta vulgaris subsp. vulgaris]|nr:hypothetical protein BVRB_3g058570 [Beta vulgaris subsp. vulgaris]